MLFMLILSVYFTMLLCDARFMEHQYSSNNQILC